MNGNHQKRGSQSREQVINTNNVIRTGDEVVTILS